MSSRYKKFLVGMGILGFILLIGLYVVLDTQFTDHFKSQIRENSTCHVPPANAPKPNEVNPLCAEVAKGAGPEAVYLRLKAGVRLNLLDVNDQTPLMCSTLLGQADPDTVKALLAAGSAWDIPNKKGETVLDLLATKDSVNAQVIKKIIMTEKLVSLCADGSVEEVKNAIDQGINLDLPNAFQTPLMAATTDAEWGVPKAKLLLAAGAKVNGRNGDRMVPLQAAAALDNVEMVDLLLKEGAEVNAMDDFGRTALWEALHQGRTKCSDHIKDKAKECPSLILQEQVVELLKEAGATSQPTLEALKAF